MVLTPVKPAVDLDEKMENTSEDELAKYSIESKACAIGWESIRKCCYSYRVWNLSSRVKWS